MKEALLAVNPRSGVDRNKETMIEAAVRLAEGHGVRLDVEFTSGPGDARRLAAEAVAAGKESVIAAGGDGTVRDVADGLWGTETAMGIVPLGSGNGLARSLGLPQDFHEALRVALGSHTVRIDRGTANGRSFYSAFGVGFDAEVSYQFSLDKRRGRTTYIKHALRQMFSFRPGRYRISSSTGGSVIETEALLVAVCNCQQYGNNAYIAPKADPTDGKLDVTVVHQGNFMARLAAGVDLFSGTLDHNVLVEMFRSAGLTIEGSGDCVVHLDGEPMHSGATIHLACEKSGVKVAVKEENKVFRPVLTPMKCIWDDLMADIRKNINNALGDLAD